MVTQIRKKIISRSRKRHLPRERRIIPLSTRMLIMEIWRDIIEVQRANTQKVIESKKEQGGVCNAQI